MAAPGERDAPHLFVHQLADDVDQAMVDAANVIVTHAGQGCVADVADERPAIVLPQSRPVGERYVTGEALRRHRRAVVIRSWPDSSAWRALILDAGSTNPTRWRNWQNEGASARAAHSIEAVAGRCSTDGAP